MPKWLELRDIQPAARMTLDDFTVGTQMKGKKKNKTNNNSRQQKTATLPHTLFNPQFHSLCLSEYTAQIRLSFTMSFYLLISLCDTAIDIQLVGLVRISDYLILESVSKEFCSFLSHFFFHFFFYKTFWVLFSLVGEMCVQIRGYMSYEASCGWF